MLGSLSGRSKWAILSSVAVLAAGLLLFQNCGKAGFDGDTNSLDSVTQNATTDDGSPFPFEANLNLISYMSCPGAPKATRTSEDTMNAFYSVRAGAYDNTAYITSFGDGGLAVPDLYHRLVGGVGLSSAYVNFQKIKNPTLDKAKLVNSIMTNVKAQGLRPTLALINEDRSRATGGFGWDYQSYAQTLGVLTEGTMATYIAGQTVDSGYGTRRQSFFSAMDPTERGLVNSISWGGGSEADRDKFNTQLRSNLILTLGYMADGAGDITQLASPDADQYTTTYGRGYRMSFTSRQSASTNSGQDVISARAEQISDIEEMDMTTKPLTSIRGQEGQNWRCFSLRVVRDSDRINPITGHPFTSPGLYNSTDGTVAGVKRACPVQTIDNMNTTTSVNGVTVALNMERLQMARRVLPADLWEINTDPNYMCAVPSTTATQQGSCYASGDTDTSKYIQYSITQTMTDGSTKACGSATGGNECPAFVSVCYRTQ